LEILYWKLLWQQKRETNFYSKRIFGFLKKLKMVGSRVLSFHIYLTANKAKICMFGTLQSLRHEIMEHQRIIMWVLCGCYQHMIF